MTVKKLSLIQAYVFAVLADINFPTRSICMSGDKAPKEYRADGLKIPQLLDAILTLMPLDAYVSCPVSYQPYFYTFLLIGCLIMYRTL